MAVSLLPTRQIVGIEAKEGAESLPREVVGVPDLVAPVLITAVATVLEEGTDLTRTEEGQFVQVLEYVV